MRRSLISIGLLCAGFLSAQQMRFEPLKTLESTPDATVQKLMGSPDLKTSDYLVTRWMGKDKINRLVLLRRRGQEWIVYRLYEESTNSDFKLTEDERFLTYLSENRSVAKGHTEKLGYFTIVDLERSTQISFIQSAQTENWNPENVTSAGTPDKVETSGCDTKILFLGKGRFQASNTSSGNSGGDCLPSGVYEIKDGTLIKT